MNQFSGLINERIEAMRRKLQDTSRRNPLINNVLSAKTASFIRIVDEKPQSILNFLVNLERKMMLVPLPPVDIHPPDEDSAEFRNAFLNAQSSDEVYLQTIEKIDFENDEKAPDKQENADRSLKDRVRDALEMPPRPRSDQLSDLINHAKSHGINPSSSLPPPHAKSDDDRFDDNKLQTLLLPKTFQSRLSSILSKARMYQEERGLDVVYVALGYLKWTLPNAEKQDEFKSPILLLPVELTKQKSDSGEIYSIVKFSEPLFNPSLDHKLTVEAKIDLSSLRKIIESEKIDVEALFETVAELKPKNMLWSVQREASFGVYPFQGIELYHDLDTQICNFSSFPIVSELMVGKDSSSRSNTMEFSEDDVDSHVGKQLVPHIVLDADSSQFISLLKVANNENVALEGPPGSGKSQTIVNAIANAIYTGKKVLFVAQKVTALEVVLSRLQSLGLNKFVLPLMGGHGSTDEFYEAVGNRLAMRPSILPRDLDNLKAQYDTYRHKLSAYIDVLTRPVKGTGMSVHQVLGISISNAKFIQSLPLKLRNVRVYPEKLIKDFGPSDIDSMALQIADWCLRLLNNKIPKSSPWVDAPAETLDTNVINGALVDFGRASIEIDSALSKLNAEETRLIFEFFNNPLQVIEHRINEISSDPNLIIAYELCVEKGKTDFDEYLRDLIDANENLSAFQVQLGLSFKELRTISASKRRLLQLQNLVVALEVESISIGSVKSLEANLINRRSVLHRLISIKPEILSWVSSSISVQQILAFELSINDQATIQLMKSYLKELGIDGFRAEFRKVKQLFKSRSQIFLEEETPSSYVLSNLQSTIQSGGMFSFLSSNFKSAMQEASRLLRTNGSKQSALGRLQEAQAFIKDWENLEIYNQVDILNSQTIDLLSNLQNIMDSLETTINSSGVNFFTALQVSTFDGLKDFISDLNISGSQNLSWDQISSEAALVESQLELLQGSLNDLIDAEKIFASLNSIPLSDLQNLINNSGPIDDVLVKRSKSIDALDADFSDDEFARAVFAASKSLNDLPVATLKLLFDANFSQVLDTLDKLLPMYRICQKSFTSIMLAKKVNIEWISLNQVLEVLAKHRSDQSGLSSLISRRAVFSEAENAGLENLLFKMEEAGISENFEEVAKAALSASLQDQVQHEFGALLMQFDGTSLSAARKKIQSIDRKVINISRHEVANSAIARSKPPAGISYGKKSDYTELGLLNHELQKERRTPPRKVLKRAQNALMEMFPCYMMVPTAVAQHLPKKTVFDLVIIDEASQMTPEHSISALMRAKNAFIAGDTNQLPPTSFFKGLSVDEEEDDDVVTTEESILELANVQFHPKHRLLWHYRSKHEDLIAFSNHYVYDSELVIFPSPNPTTKELGVSLIEVNGTFQRGINPAEAQVMLDAIVQFMKETPNRSLGVAVMNQSQMEQLEALVLREAESNKAVQKYIDHWASANQGLEKFFVKNLENVQGDERDVIFVGTVYGRDPEGRFYQRFGPINGPAGKRRLNVLFSRAKEQMVTFSSIPLSEFNPSPTNEGATLLRRWLEFSATKRLGEVPHSHDRAGQTDSPFEDHVIEAVKSLGYEAVPQVGVSSYFIDIGVKHPSYPFGYICGVECDGATYHSSKSARDRDRLREEVLNRLGWDLHRIWSTDWFRDPLGCREILKKYLAERLLVLVRDMPKVVQPKPVEPKIVDVSSQQPERKNVVSRNTTPAKVEIPTPAANLGSSGVKIGSKISVRYLNGPRAGVVTKFVFQKTTYVPRFEIDGFRQIGPDSPLGQALEGAQIGEILVFHAKGDEIRVQVMDLENP